jgi:hypothetical protein
MKKLVVGGALLGLALAGPALAATSVSVNIGIGSAPPPPVVVYREQPPWTFVPERRVYVVDDDRCDYDLFRVGTYLYIYNDGWWYRARSHRGPFVAIEERRVPESIFLLPEGRYRWRHHPHGMPPGLAKKMARTASHDHGNHHGRH